MCSMNWDTPWKINMELQNGGLEDDFPLQFGDFGVPYLSSWVYSNYPSLLLKLPIFQVGCRGHHCISHHRGWFTALYTRPLKKLKMPILSLWSLTKCRFSLSQISDVEKKGEVWIPLSRRSDINTSTWVTLLKNIYKPKEAEDIIYQCFSHQTGYPHLTQRTWLVKFRDKLCT